MPRMLRSLSVAVVAAFVASVFVAAPASAALEPLAYTEVREVLSGDQQIFVFAVTNKDPLKEITSVRISPETTDTFTFAHGVSFGWNYTLLPSEPDGPMTEILFTPNQSSADPGGIAYEETEGFAVFADAGVLPSDVSTNWQIQTTAEGEAPKFALPDTARAANALTTAIKVLKVDEVLITAPELALDYSATQGQTVTVESVVENHGSTPLPVTSTLLGTQDTQTAAPAPQTVPAGGAATFEHQVRLGSAATRTLKFNASAPGSDAIDGETPQVTIDSPTFFSALSMSPSQFPSGTVQSFVVTLQKSMRQEFTFDDTTELRFTKQGETTPSFVTKLAGPASAPAGVPRSFTLAFQPVAIPGDPLTGDRDGAYNVQLAVRGTDGNGVAASPNVTPSAVTVDSKIPVVAVTVAGPSGQTGADGAAVVEPGDALTFGGTVKKAPSDTTNDGTARIEQCTLVLYDSVGGALGSKVQETDVATSQCRVSNPPSGLVNEVGQPPRGTITGGAPAPAADLARGFLRLEVDVADAAGNVARDVASGWLAFDAAAPAIAEAATGCPDTSSPTCNRTRMIAVGLSEPVKGEFAPADFSVPGNAVVAASSSCSRNAYCDQVVLTLAQAFSEETTPAVTYAFVGQGVRARPADGVGRALADQTVTSVDGIAPDLPVLQSVSRTALGPDGPVEEQQARQDGQFFTNRDLPTFEISGLEPGYRVIVARDVSGAGTYEQGLDPAIAECTATAAAVSCPAQVPLGSGPNALVIASIDNAGNMSAARSGSGNARPETVDLDRVPASITGVSFASAPVTGAKSVTVAFDEIVATGRNAAADWRAFVLVGGRKRFLRDTAVSGSGSSRVLALDASETQTTVGGVIYLLEAGTTQRYRDRAGNYFANTTFIAP